MWTAYECLSLKELYDLSRFCDKLKLPLYWGRKANGKSRSGALAPLEFVWNSCFIVSFIFA